MPEPRTVQVNYNSDGPGFDDLAKGLTPDQKHRYTQWRSSQRQAYADAYDSGKLKGMRERGETFPNTLSMFARPGTDEDSLFEMMGESETDSQSEIDHPFGKDYGSNYASQTAAMQRNPIRISPGTKKALEPSPTAYADGNGRYVGISERTFLQPESPLANAAKRRLEKARGQRR
jgi:hypothetical protein